MKWVKRGLVYGPDGSSSWAKHSALQPTPMLLNDRTIRVFVGFRDDAGVSRVGFVDVSSADPACVLNVSGTPALDVGIPGSFDDNGVVPCALATAGHRLYLYYAGYQIPAKVKFMAFGGLATSDDGGCSFTRYSQVPVTDRTDNELYFRVPHSVLVEGGVWRVWYGGGSQFSCDGVKRLPCYNIRYQESPDGISFPPTGRVCLDVAGPEEYRIGRPCVVRHGDGYRMFFCAATRSRGFRLAYAESTDGIAWHRDDSRLWLDTTPGAWDSEMTCYPSVLRCPLGTYLFYNGNEYGRKGFGYAILDE